jgi:cyclohexa-1,5-dienecarbonyl-CoA hydratase
LLEIETLYLDELMQSHDAVEGLNAFIEKRNAKWEHR